MIDSADVFLRPSSRQLVATLLLEGASERDKKIRNLLYLAAQKITDANLERYEMARALCIVLKRIGGSILVPRQIAAAVSSSDELSIVDDERTGDVLIFLRGAA